MRLAILVEGRTEEEFVNNLLRHTLQHTGISAVPILLNGNVSVQRVASEMANLFWDFDCVTSLIDFYGFKDKGNESPDTLQTKIDKNTGEVIRRKYDESKVFSYVQKYEFEGLLFSAVDAFDRLYGDSAQYSQELGIIRSKFQSPEEINDNPSTAPSKCLAKVISSYSKVVDGPLIAIETGLSTIRAECPRFGSWVTRLELLGCQD